MTLQTKDQVFSVIDTTLLKCYLNVSHTSSRRVLCFNILTLLVPETKMAEFANSVDLDEVAHNEPPHQDLHYLPSSL